MLENLINYNYTQSSINKILNKFDGSVYKPSPNDSFGNNLTVSQRFILSVFYSILISAMIYSPLQTLAEAILCVVTKKRKVKFKPNCQCRKCKKNVDDGQTK